MPYKRYTEERQPFPLLNLRGRPGQRCRFLIGSAPAECPTLPERSLGLGDLPTSGYGSWNWQRKALESARVGRSPFGDGFDGIIPSGPGAEDVQMASGEGRKKSSVSRDASLGHCHALFHPRFCLGHSAALSCRRRRGSR